MRAAVIKHGPPAHKKINVVHFSSGSEPISRRPVSRILWTHPLRHCGSRRKRSGVLPTGDPVRWSVQVIDKHAHGMAPSRGPLSTNPVVHICSRFLDCMPHRKQADVHLSIVRPPAWVFDVPNALQPSVPYVDGTLAYGRRSRKAE